MKRKQPTEEQRARAAARREAFRKLAADVSSMPDEQRAALVNRAGGIFTVEGRPLSVVNSCLVLAQCPSASMVGGFAQWLRAGRCVRKGESGLAIWIPTGGRSNNNGPADVSSSGEPIAEAGDAKANPRTRFIMGTVFDVSQTDAIAERETDEPEPFVVLDDSPELAFA